jgi:hypothetical protein
MTSRSTPTPIARHPGALSRGLIAGSFAVAITCIVALDGAILNGTAELDAPVLLLLLNGIALLQSAVGAIIEWRRPGHAIGRLLLVSGPLFAFLAMGWIAGDGLAPVLGPSVYPVVDWGVALLSYAGMAVIAGWLPLLFPTGTLPGPRWRVPVAILVAVSACSLIVLATRPGQMTEGGLENPFGIGGWPPVLQVLVDSLLLQLLVLIAMAVTSLAVRYRRGDDVERHQIRWFLGAAGLVGVGFAGLTVETILRTGNGIPGFIVVAFVGVLLMPVAIGIAVLRYRLYEIDRIISRTIGWAIVTGILVAVFAGLVVALQTLLAPLTEENTFAVAASTLVAFALFQPLRRRVQHAVDRRFDRSRFDGELVAAAFAERLRGEVDVSAAHAALITTASAVVKPQSAAIWLRNVQANRSARVS